MTGHAAAAPGGSAQMGAAEPRIDEDPAARQKRLEASGVTGLQYVDAAPFGPAAVERWKLANGLEILLARDPLSPVVAVHTWVTVGSADEVPGKTGLAHLLEHAMFKSTTTRPAGTFDRLLEQHGASANAGTWYDWTMYHEVVPPAALATVLELEADRLAHLDLSAAAVRSELEVVRNERRESVDDDPDGMVAEALWSAAFGYHPYGHPVIGTAQDLASMGVADVVGYYRSHYVPGRTAVVLAGAFDPAQALTWIAQYYGGLAPSKAPPRTQVLVAKPSGTQASVDLSIDAGSARLAIAWRTVALDHPDHVALAALAEVLAGSDSARLHRALVDDAKLASHVGADQTDLRLGGLLEIQTTLRPGAKSAEALKIVEKEVADLLGGRPIAEQELAAAKNRMKTQQLRELASADGRADVLGHTWATTAGLDAHARWWQRLQALEVADVQQVAQVWLKAQGRTVVRAEPPPPSTSRAQRKRSAG